MNRRQFLGFAAKVIVGAAVAASMGPVVKAQEQQPPKWNRRIKKCQDRGDWLKAAAHKAHQVRRYAAWLASK
jgi:hypothetical protein